MKITKAVLFGVCVVCLTMISAEGAGGTTGFLSSQGLEVGCNYWASHAGVYMWRNWNAECIERDLDKLADCGLTILRVFPLWPDFQPLTVELSSQGTVMGWGQADGPLRNEAAVDDEMIGRFRLLCDAAEKRGIKLVVGLVTGFMSARLFVPQCLAFKNPITDPDSVMWQTRFVRYFVTALKDHPAIAAWDLGNECNCMGPSTQTELRNWMLAISSVIRIADPIRPVVTGMHGVSSDRSARAPAFLQAETCDILTTHPYPLWTPGCNTEPFDTIRNGCHAACETTLYAALSGKPAFVEEAGSMGPGIVSEARAASSMRAALFSCWAAGIKAYLWWCAFDQNKLNFPPYDWTSIERELGLFDAEGSPKPTALQMKDFTSFIKTLPFRSLPARQIDATVVVSERENAWCVAQGAWLLSRQAGFDIGYSSARAVLPKSNFYILPSGCGYKTYSASLWHALREKVRDGATMLVTLGSGAVLSEFEETVGGRVESHFADRHVIEADFGSDSFKIDESHRRRLTPTTARVLVRERTGEPLMLENSFGKGKLIYFNAALEQSAQLAGWPAYRLAAERAGVRRRVRVGHRAVGITEHPADNGCLYAVVVNYAPEAVECSLWIDGSVRDVFGNAEIGNDTLSIGANDGCVLVIDK